MSLADLVSLGFRPLRPSFRRRLLLRKFRQLYLMGGGGRHRLIIRQYRRRRSLLAKPALSLLTYRPRLRRRPRRRFSRRFRRAVAGLRQSFGRRRGVNLAGREFRSAFRSLLLQALPRRVVCRRKKDVLVAVALARRRVRSLRKFYRSLFRYLCRQKKKNRRLFRYMRRQKKKSRSLFRYMRRQKKKNRRLLKLYLSLKRFFSGLSKRARQRKKKRRQKQRFIRIRLRPFPLWPRFPWRRRPHRGKPYQKKKRRFRPLFRSSFRKRMRRYLDRRLAKDRLIVKKRLRYFFYNVNKWLPRMIRRARGLRHLLRRRSRRVRRVRRLRRFYRFFRSSPRGWLLLAFRRFRYLLRKRLNPKDRRRRLLSNKRVVLLHGFVNSNLYRYNRNKLKSTGKGFVRLHKGYLRGFSFDYPDRYEKFRWPERLYQVYAIDPLKVWEKLVARSFLFGRHFAFLHKDQHTLTDYQRLTMYFLFLFYSDLYGLPGWLPLEKAPPFLFHGKAEASLYLYWQHPVTLHDQFLEKEGYYNRRVTYTPWSRWLPYYFLGDRLPSLLRTSLLWDFVDREYRFWQLWACVWDFRISLWWLSVKHPHWFLDYHLERLALALAFLPKAIRRRFTSHWRRMAGCYARLWTAKLRRERKIRRRTLQQKIGLYMLQGIGRQRSWFIRQQHFFRRMMGSVRWIRDYGDRYRLFTLGRLYRRLWSRDRDSFPSSRLPALFAPSFLMTVDRWPQWRRRVFRRRFNFLGRRQRAKSLWSRTRRIIRRRCLYRHRPAVIRPSMFFWKLLALWLLIYYKRVTTTVPIVTHYHWLLQETFALPTTVVDLWFFTGGYLQPAFRCTPYRLACFRWVERKVKKTNRRRRRFRLWFHKFFLRRRWSHFGIPYYRPKIPGYYRRFNYIRSLPLSSFRLFWPQSANFARPRRWYSPQSSKAGGYKRSPKVAPLTVLSMVPKKVTAVHFRPDLSNGRPYSHGRSKQDRSYMGLKILVSRKNLVY